MTLVFSIRARLFVSLSLIWARSVSRRALDCVMRDEMMVYFELQYHTNNNRLRVDCVYCPNHMLVSHGVCFCFFRYFHSEEFRERLCMQTIKVIPKWITLAFELSLGISRSRARCIRSRLDTRTLSREDGGKEERKRRANQPLDSVSPVQILMLNFLLVSLCPPGVMNSFMMVW